MKTNILTVALTALFCISCGVSKTQNQHPQQAEGGERGNGADYHYIGENNPWFVDLQSTQTHKIKYCIELKSDFGVEEATADQLVREAFLEWGKYFKERELDAAAELVTSLDKLQSCDGTEDIAFYFGTSNSQVKKYEHKFNNSLGFSVKTSSNSDTLWSKGFIWIAPPGSIEMDYPNQGMYYPDWTIGNNLKGILLHEIGHVYGIGHISETIMTKDFDKLLDLRKSYTPNEDALAKIDHVKELILDRKNISKKGLLGYDYTRTTSINGQTTTERINTVSKNFNKLFGRNPEGKVSALVHGSNIENLFLQVSDSKSSRDFPIALRGKNAMESKSYVAGEEGIQIIKKSDHSIQNYIDYSSSEAEVIYAVLKTDSQPLDLIIERNLNSCRPYSLGPDSPDFACKVNGPFAIKTFTSSGIEVLFRSDLVMPFPHNK